MIRLGIPVLLLSLAWCPSLADAQVLVIPRRHDRPPGPPVSASEAVARMTVPDGFNVEIVAAEPDVVNPVAMFIDERGRFWVTESFEYPRQESGPGRDRIKVLEDTDGDGKVDKVTVFAEGLNIPSGIAVGHGGVWVANAPDILFLQDTDGDLKADRTEVLLTGFGRTDTHELPNSFTWGPDGWLYGLNGVFNYCDVKYGKDNPNARPDHPGWKFTCALFRIHPRTREFQVFCEGTSNPWGIAINDRGDFFVSACVIDHLWHLSERGYYIRQGGPYPAHTWPMRSIVNHTHQKAAYCGITWFDSDAYPAEYRNTLYMGNIHGNCVNADVLEAKGATYVGKAHPGFPARADAWKNDAYGVIRKTGDEKSPKLADLLQANDQWFMPVVQKTGPDGCLYVLDWYDQYHCYQDANADPAGIDRSKGRLYRLRYKDNPYAQPFDLARKSDDELIGLLRDSNVYVRETAQRLLAERDTPEIAARLQAKVLAGNALPRDPYRELFALASLSRVNVPELVSQLLKQNDPGVRAFAIRMLGDAPRSMPEESRRTLEIACQLLANDPSPVVRLQAVVAAAKSGVSPQEQLPAIVDAIARTPLEEPVNQITWEVLKPLIAAGPGEYVARLKSLGPQAARIDSQILQRSADVVMGVPDLPPQDVLSFLEVLRTAGPAGQSAAVQAVRRLTAAVQTRAIRDARLRDFEAAFLPVERQSLAAKPATAFNLEIIRMSASWGDERARTWLKSNPDGWDSVENLVALVAGNDPDAFARACQAFEDRKLPREQVLAAMSRMNDDRVAAYLIQAFPKLDGGLKPKVIDLLCERQNWSLALLRSIQDESIPKTALNLNQLRRVAGFRGEQQLQVLFRELYGAVRENRSPDRDRVISNMRNTLDTVPGDPHAGQAVFRKVCAQCHKIHGEGAEVGPDITLNGRNNWEQLLSNVLDPSLVIGKGYQARILATNDGRVLTGLPVEETDKQVVLKVQGGKLETIPRTEIEAYRVSELSMMPEALEKQLSAQEMADLFAFLALDKPPSDPTAKLLNGAPRPGRK